ncbi:MAG: hypothetical protein ABR582_17040, partial [Gemmatimonadaceae bacterium]
LTGFETKSTSSSRSEQHFPEFRDEPNKEKGVVPLALAGLAGLTSCAGRKNRVALKGQRLV